MPGVGTVISRGAQSAQNMQAAEQTSQGSVFDVWTHSYDGMAARMDAAVSDPVGFLADDPAQQARIAAAQMPGQWSSSSIDQMAGSMAAQAGTLGDQVQAISDAQGALQTIGATFALLTSIEQIISSLLSVIPFPAFPAVRIADMDIGLPHAHSHPPNLVPPAPPVPLPSTGPVIPIPILSGAGKTLINGMPAARCGDMGLGVWCGGYFPMYEVFLGSSNVWIEGARAARVALDITKHCMFTTPKPQDLPLGPMIGMTISSSSNVMIGGVPMPSLVSLGIGAAFKGLARILGKGARAFARLTAPLRRRAGDALDSVTCFMKRTLRGAEPVHLITGEVLVEQQDFSIPAPLPLEWDRVYGSHKKRSGVCGSGWSTPADTRLVFEPDGVVVFYDGVKGPRLFPGTPTTGHHVLEFSDGAKLSRYEDGFVVELKTGLFYHFPFSPNTAEIMVSHITDRCGNYQSYLRDKNGLKEIVEKSGRRLEVRSEAGLIREIHLRYPNKKHTTLLVRYEYSKNGELTAVYNALGNPYAFDYDDHRRLVKHTDRNGLSFYYAYEDNTQTARCHHAWGDGGLYDYHFSFDPVARQVKYKNSLDAEWTLQLNEMNLPQWEIDPIGGITHYEYDSQGRNTAVIDPDGYRTDYQYDENGNLVRLTRPDGKTIETTFNAKGQAVQIVDPSGAVWHQEWDTRGLLACQTTPLGAESRYTYDSRGLLVGFTNPNGARTDLSFDGYGNLTCLTDALSHATTFDYDILGNVITKIDPLGQLTSYRYDFKGRLYQATLPSGATISYAYDPEDNLIHYIDENGAETKLEYCGLGEIKRRLQPDGHSVEYHYDTEERLIGVTNQRGKRYQLVRDPLGRITAEIDYWGQTRRYTYSMAGHLQQSNDPLDRTIQYQTDPLGRITQKLLPTLFDPDQVQAEIFKYDANGNLTACENTAICIQRTFDAEGRLIEERQGEAATITNTYDPNGNRLSRSFDLNIGKRHYTNTIEYEYDLLDQSIGVTLAGHPPIQFQRNALGQLISEQLSEHIQRDLTYSPEGYLTAQKVRSKEGPMFEQTYRYDPAGNLTEKQDSALGTDQFTYNPLGRLVAHLDPQGQLKNYLNDPAGDRLQTRTTQETPDRGGHVDWRREGVYDDDGTYYRFDRAGNLVRRKEAENETLLCWDANQRLVESATNDQRTRYLYDPLGRRVSKTTAGIATHFFWDADTLLGDLIDDKSEENGTKRSQLREWVYYPQTCEPMMLLLNFGALESGLCLYHNDPNGCPVRLLDPSGEIVWAAQYSAWGGIERLYADKVDNPIRLQGQYEDTETKFYYNRFRYYNPSIGEAISQDPLGLRAGINLYSYALNVTGWIDPLGLTCGPKFPRIAEEMDELMGFRGTRLPDVNAGTGAPLPGRGRVDWDIMTPQGRMRITYEAHPYHPTAPDFHKLPHYHVDIPGTPYHHARFSPGDPIPGY